MASGRSIAGRSIQGRAIAGRSIVGTGGLVPAPACSIVLTDDAADSFGVKTPTLDGQSFSVAPADGSGLYLASTALPASVRAIPTTRILWIRVPDMTATASTGSGSVSCGFVLFDSGGSATHRCQIRKTSGGGISIQGGTTASPAGTFNVTLSGNSDRSNEYIGIGNDLGTDSVWYYNTSTGAAQATGDMVDFLATANVVSCALLGDVDLSGGGTGTYSAEFVTDQNSFGVDLSGDEDFCGNVIA